MTKDRAKTIALATAGTLAMAGATLLMGGVAHAQVLSATDANTIVATNQTEIKSFLTTTLPLVLGGLIVLAYVYKMYHRIRRGQ